VKTKIHSGAIMNTEVPYMVSVSNLTRILDAIQKAGAPDAFGLDFLKDLGFTSSNDRSVIKLFKYLGFLDSSGKPQPAYREFMDGSKAKAVLGARIRVAYDDLFLADKAAQNQSVDKLKGWFKTKTGAGDAVAQKIATTFRTLATYATFDDLPLAMSPPLEVEKPLEGADKLDPEKLGSRKRFEEKGILSFAYRIEVHLPDTTNVETYRAIFKAIREELG
jgi:hypothetical protein